MFEGFVNNLKEHLREKMFAESFKVDENSNGLGMVSTQFFHKLIFRPSSIAFYHVQIWMTS